MNGHAERRTETRLDQQATIFVEICTAADDEDTPKVVICHSIDISANGIQVQMDEPMPIGSILRLCAEFKSDKEPMYLVGEVKWNRNSGDEYFIGFELFDAEDTDIISWKNIIAHQLR